MIYRQKIRKQQSIKMAAKTKLNMKNRFRGFIFCAFWFLSIIAGFFLLVCPILPLAVISPKRYRKWSDVIFGMWEPFPVAMMEVCFGIRVVLSGDKINPFEGSLFVMNHRTRVDWNFLWLGLFHCCQPNAHNMKYVLKAPIMHVPGPGWVMQTCSFIFVHRNWTRDRPLLDKMLDYLNESDSLYQIKVTGKRIGQISPTLYHLPLRRVYPALKYEFCLHTQILLFPEGTDLTESNIQKSHRYADEHNLVRYHRVLHPRTTGFAFLANKMKSGGQLKAVYDLTVAYPKTMPLTEADLFRGKFPEEVHFHVKRHSSSNIPYEEEDLKTWLNNIWHEKEKKLEKFYTTGSFSRYEIDSVSEENLDFGKISMANGEIKFNYGEHSNVVKNSNRKEVSVGSDSSLRSPRMAAVQAETSATQEAKFITLTESKEFERNHINCEDVYRSKNYRPSHLLYLVLVFWITLIIFIVHQLIYNFYVQLWVLTHSVLFSALSFVSNGFHNMAASFYFYRNERKPVLKKSE